MKKILLLSSLMLFFYLREAVGQCQNLVLNPQFIDVPAHIGNDFDGANICPPWRPSHGTATFSVLTVSGGSGDGSAIMWSAMSDPPPTPYMVGEGILTNNFGLQAKREYLFSMMAMNFSTNGASIPLLRADFSDFSPTAPFNIPAYSNLVNVQNIIWRSPFSATSFTTCQRCITPDRAWSNVWIHLENDSSTDYSVAWAAIDDVELVPNFDYAGPDRSICRGEKVKIGDNCSYLHIGFQYQWTPLGGNFPVSWSPTINVSPVVTTSYVLRRTPLGSDLSSCVAYDTVTVTVLARPIKPCLGPDTALCTPGCYTITNPYERCPNGVNLADFEFKLNGKPVTFPLTICESGQYILCVKNSGAANCKECDTINLKFHPELPHRDTVLYYCENTFPKTICTYDGYRYRWNTAIPGDTLKCLKIYSAGKYIVTLTDSFGCQTKDTFNIRLKSAPYVTLPPDTVLCGSASIVLDGGIGMKHYLWNTGDTTRKIIVTASGRYIVTVMSYDSCFGSDTIDVIIRHCPIFTNLTYAPFCANDDCITLNVQPKLGKSFSYAGTGIVAPNKFCPKIAGCGYHNITYHFIDSFGCACDTTFSIYVKCLTPPKIDSVGYLCLSDGAKTLHATPSGGTFSGRGVSKGKFNPGAAGTGWHWIKYCYTDTFGCTACDSIKIKVVLVHASIIFDTDTATLCNKEPVKLIARGGNKFYWPHNGSTDSIIYANKDTTYCVVVSDDSTGCPDTACITLHRQDCCTGLGYTDPFITPGGTVYIYPGSPFATYSNTNLVITGTVHIMPGATWTLNNCKVILKQCARIIIDRSDPSIGMPAAKMFVYNSKLLGCKWKGIEVWGVYDDCNADTTDNTVAGSGMIQGKLTMVNSTITDADMAIFVGRRIDTNLGLQDWEYYSGGVIDIQGCHFYNNHADIVFSEYNVFNIACGNNCKQLSKFSVNLASKIENNYFDTLKPLEECDLFLTKYLFNSHAVSRNNNPWYCHIINFTDNPIYTKGAPVGIPPMYNPVCLDLESDPNTWICNDDIRNKFNNNFYTNPCPSNLKISNCNPNNNGYK